jgi:hypothetical protein
MVALVLFASSSLNQYISDHKTEDWVLQIVVKIVRVAPSEQNASSTTQHGCIHLDHGTGRLRKTTTNAQGNSKHTMLSPPLTVCERPSDSPTHSDFLSEDPST